MPMGGFMSDSALIEVKVDALTRLPGNTVSLNLVAANGRALPPFEAGAHIDVVIEEGLTRQYSLCGDPATTGVYRLGVLRDADSRGGSAALNERLQQGDTLRVSAPKNHFPLKASGQHSVLIGGGIGITPLISMAHKLWQDGQSFELRYCFSDAADAAFLNELNSAPFAKCVTDHQSRGDTPNKYDPKTELPEAAEDIHIYVCGPSGFMDWIIEAALARGYSENQLHKEDFGAEVDLSGGTFEVEARASGVTVQVGEGQRIVEALTDAGIDIEVSCEEGVCGTCLCDVLEGEPDHRDSFLTEDERQSNEMIMVCCSRARSAKLVLDV